MPSVSCSRAAAARAWGEVHPCSSTRGCKGGGYFIFIYIDACRQEQGRGGGLASLLREGGEEKLGGRRLQF